jgi:hypothetical protein
VSVVIVGGHDRMVCIYKDVCKEFRCKSKVFTQMPSNLKGKIGSPDLLILFTSTMSHKMLRCAVETANKNKIKIARCHTSSTAALKMILEEHCN